VLDANSQLNDHRHVARMERFDNLCLRLQEKQHLLHSRKFIVEVSCVGLPALCCSCGAAQKESVRQLHGPVGIVFDVFGVRLLLALAQGTDVAARPRDSIVHAPSVRPPKQLHVGEVCYLAVCA